MKLPQHYSERLDRQGNVSSAQYRAELVVSLLERLAPAAKNGEVLDVGCGPAIVLNHLRRAGYRSLAGADALEESVVALKNGGFEAFQIDLNNAAPGFPDRQFDVILILEVLEHLYDPGRTLQVLKTHLKPGGLLVASVPNEYRLQKRLAMLRGKEIADATLVGGHIKFFSYAGFRRLIETEGFEIVEQLGAGGHTVKRLPLGARLVMARPDLFAKWNFVVARASRANS